MSIADDVPTVTLDSGEEALHVTEIPPQKKHPTIFQTFDNLEAGGSFVLVNDHDPVPLKYQMQGERGEDAFEWEYLEEGPEVWQVRLTKTD